MQIILIDAQSGDPERVRIRIGTRVVRLVMDVDTRQQLERGSAFGLLVSAAPGFMLKPFELHPVSGGSSKPPLQAHRAIAGGR